VTPFIFAKRIETSFSCIFTVRRDARARSPRDMLTTHRGAKVNIASSLYRPTRGRRRGLATIKRGTTHRRGIRFVEDAHRCGRSTRAASDDGVAVDERSSEMMAEECADGSSSMSSVASTTPDETLYEEETRRLALARKPFDVNLRAHTRVRSTVKESDDEDLSLSAYMRLPVSQYVDVPLPLGATMEKVGSTTGDEARDEEFTLTIPGLKFLSLEVQPVINVRVRCLGDGESVLTWHGREWDEDQDRKRPGARPETWRAALRGPCVLIEIVSARVEGKLVEELGINDMFVNHGTTAFRWRSKGDGSLDGPALTRTGYAEDEDRATEQESEGACIMGWTDIGVGVDPPGPFAKLPRSLTQRVGDAVLGTTLSVLQRVFIGGLASDYERWAADEKYRTERAIHGEQ